MNNHSLKDRSIKRSPPAMVKISFEWADGCGANPGASTREFLNQDTLAQHGGNFWSFIGSGLADTVERAGCGHVLMNALHYWLEERNCLQVLQAREQAVLIALSIALKEEVPDVG